MTRTLTRENSDIIFDIPFKRRYGLFCSNLMFTMKKKNVVGEKNVEVAIFTKKFETFPFFNILS